MIELRRTDLANLQFLIGAKRYTLAQDLLEDPFAMKGRLFLQRTPEKFSIFVGRLYEIAYEHPTFKRLFDLHLITHFLLFRGDQPEWFTPWLVNAVDLGTHLPGMTWEQILRSDWTPVPVLVVLDEARVVYFITGLTPKTERGRPWPEWADPLMDAECRSTVEAAVSVVASMSMPSEDRSYFCYPLLAPSETIQIKGPSLGLSLALGFLSSAKAKVLPRFLAASGALGLRGLVGQVEALEKKICCSEARGFRVFLYPSCGERPTNSRLELLPVTDIREAWMFAQLYAPGRSRDLMILSEMLKSPEVFVNNVDLMEPEWLTWVRREGMAENVLNGILDAPRRFSVFVDKMEWAVKHWKLELARAMTAFVPPSGLLAATSGWPLAVLRFCTQVMALSNHRGDVAEAVVWANEGDRLFERALKADVNACADFLNNRFIVQHNQYRFSLDFPEELKAILDCLKNRHMVQCAGGCVADKTLAELYGSVMQNHAFCGSEHIAETERYSMLSRRAFGDGDIPELRQDWLRQLNYLAYAELDACLFERAERTLLAYLEIQDWSHLWSVLDPGRPWQHAVLARFLLEKPVKELCDQYLGKVLKEKPVLMKEDHPWQLWAYNLGKIAARLDQTREAADWFENSLDLCFSDAHRFTVHMMALLPLSGLWKVGRLWRTDLVKAKERIMDSAEILNPEYFRVLREKDFEEVLRLVWENPGELFPFNYR